MLTHLLAFISGALIGFLIVEWRVSQTLAQLERSVKNAAKKSESLWPDEFTKTVDIKDSKHLLKSSMWDTERQKYIDSQKNFQIDHKGMTQ